MRMVKDKPIPTRLVAVVELTHGKRNSSEGIDHVSAFRGTLRTFEDCHATYEATM